MSKLGEKVRVSVVQFAVGIDEHENLKTCQRMIDEAAANKPDLIVLPEFLNHQSWWRDEDHAYTVATSLDGSFLSGIGAKAREHKCYIMANCTVRRRNNAVTGTNILFDPEGKLVATADKQVLMGNETNFLETAEEVSPIVETPFGNVALYSCMDGVIMETARGIALRGAHILCNSLNSFGDDEATLHIPVRAAENKVFVVSANKVGQLVSDEILPVATKRLKISEDQMSGTGESQIVAPDGTVLAIAPRGVEAVIFADIEVAEADDKVRPDGTDVFKARRPELYAPLAAKPGPRNILPGADQVEAAVYQPEMVGEAAIDEAATAAAEAIKNGVSLVVLPELFFLEDGVVDDVDAAIALSVRATDAIAKALEGSDDDRLVSTSIVERRNDGVAHVGVLISAGGIRLRQSQIHVAGRHQSWVTSLGNEQPTLDLSWGRIAVVVGGDNVFPETFRLLALKDVAIAALPSKTLETWELTTGLLERAAENRMNLVMASQPGPAGASAILATDEDFTLWTEWKHRPFDGNLNTPIVTRTDGAPGLTQATIYPICSENRTITLNTDLVDSRPWWLMDAITSPNPTT